MTWMDGDMAKNHSQTRRPEATANAVSHQRPVSYSSLASTTVVAIQAVVISSFVQLFASSFLLTSCVSRILDHSFTGDSGSV